MPESRPATRVVHAGLPAASDGEPFLPGPTFAAPFHLAGDAAPEGYGRYGNPTWGRLEEALGQLEGGEAVAFASGMAAVAAVLLALVPPNGVVVVPSDGYYQIRQLARQHLAPRGVEVREVATDEAEIRSALDGASLVWLETPSNPGLDVVDVAALATAARASGAQVAADNTLATPLGQRPLALGADLSVTSATKALSGHGDLLLGVVVAAGEQHAAALRAWRGLTGAIPGPFEAWLCHRSLATLDVRLERQCASAMALAEALTARADITAVRYPGLPHDPAHAVAARQMERFGPVVCFDLGTRDRAQRFLGACESIVEATSFGSVHSTAERRARWGGDEVPEGLIRLSAGIEDARDLVADVLRALDAVA